MKNAMPRSLVLLSGGQDSTTCLYWAIARFGRENVTSLSFDYGQRHKIELACAAQVVKIAGVPHAVLPINTFATLGGSALTDETVPVQSTLSPQSQLPNTFVPGRNLILLSFAAAYAYPRGITELVGGMAQTDYSGYPDCRETALKALEQALRLGMQFELTIHTPLMFKSKQETVRLAEELGALATLAYTHTCYNGCQPPCGECPACVLRAKGFTEAGIADPLIERFKGVRN
jgi:7-cyano-7-deazaguanine synthase